MVDTKKREGETPSALLFRFSRRVKRSGVLKEANKRRFYSRPGNRAKRKISALHRGRRRQEMARARQLGVS